MTGSKFTEDDKVCRPLITPVDAPTMTLAPANRDRTQASDWIHLNIREISMTARNLATVNLIISRPSDSNAAVDRS